jgi:hypothetical protein
MFAWVVIPKKRSYCFGGDLDDSLISPEARELREFLLI